MPQRSVDAVLFDLGNTLVSYYKPADFGPILKRSVAGMAAVLRAQGHHVDEAGLFDRALGFNKEREDLRVWPLRDRLNDLFAIDSARLPPSVLDAVVEHFLAPIFAVAQADSQALQVLKSIKATGLKCAIVSNTPWGSPAKPWRSELQRWGLLDVVDDAIFCVDAGWRKPSRVIFDLALERLGVGADRALFVGDDMRWDVEGAAQVGLIPVLLSDTDVSVPRGYTIRRLSDLKGLLQKLGN